MNLLKRNIPSRGTLKRKLTGKWDIPNFQMTFFDVARVIRSVALDTDFFERRPTDLLLEFLDDIARIHNELYERCGYLASEVKNA